MTRPVRPLGTVTRGTTHPNRLRRVDAWAAHTYGPVLCRAERPVVVDLGFGASPITTVELHQRLQRIRPDVEVVGVEIDPDRVRAAAPFTATGLRFTTGGFELGDVNRGSVVLVRALNVLRQYEEGEVPTAWTRILDGLAPQAGLIEGTCDELGRRSCWVNVPTSGVPRSVTFAARLSGFQRPSDLAERLPKALIHRNVPGERIHAWFVAWDQAWDQAAPASVFGVRQRWIAAAETMGQRGWPLRDQRSRWRLGELTVDWEAVRPAT